MPQPQSTEIRDITDLVRILEEQPHWAEILRKIIVGPELMELPRVFRLHQEEVNRQFALIQEQFREVYARFDRMEARQERMEARQDSMEARQERMETKLDDLDGRFAGAEYELKAIRGLQNVAGSSGLRRIRSLLSRIKDIDPQLADRLDEAIDEDRITGAESAEIQRADITAQARETAAGHWVYVVIEVSRTVRPDDVERAVRRARLMEQATTARAVPAVCGADISHDARRMAEAANVNVTIVQE